MPPKAAKGKEAPAERPILGRFSSHLKIGIVGPQTLTALLLVLRVYLHRLIL